MPEEQLVKLATAANEPIAGMVVGALEAEGIPAMAKAKGVGMGGWASVVMLEHDIYVRASDRQQAVEVIEPFLGAEVTLATEKDSRR
ncbi:MAG: DUF2007 domain-containing protein [Bacteroidetes bacterium]|nr:DUF2007 domain-containing protein [Bacteroidota bacterium]MCL5026666.1 DUF2007 domain-containing protein [Chloroflexota bacterium]